MTSQLPINVSADIKERVRYLATFSGVTQADIVDQAIQEVAVRHSDHVERGIDQARSVLAGGDVAIAAHLLDVPVDGVERIVGPGH